MIDLLIKSLWLVAPALRYADNPNRSYWQIHLLAYTILVWVIDMVIARVWFAPQPNEWTISHTLERTAGVSLRHMELALAINRISPGHIKSV